MKMDYKKDFKSLYLPKSTPELIQVPLMRFAVIEGSGDPNGPEFAEVTEALYGLSYAIKMSYKGDDKPDGYFEYTVFPLEGEWDLVDYTKGNKDKSNFKYNLMIRQPEFVTDEVFQYFLEKVKKKKPNAKYNRMQLISIEEGLCCQMLHLGSYDDEPESFAKMMAFVESLGKKRASLCHREIYLSDPRKTEVSKLKTVLRFKVF